MIAGLNSKGKLTYLLSTLQAQKYISKGEQFFCPDCQEPLQICCGSKNRPYFKHIIKKTNVINESELHQTGKDILWNTWQNQGFTGNKEKVIINGSHERRVDVFINPSLAIEFQCSPISTEQLKERNDFYCEQGWDSLWFLGPRYFSKDRINNNALKFLNYNIRLGFYLLFLKVEEKEIRICHHIRKYDWNQYDWIEESCPIEQLFSYRFGKISRVLKKVSVAQTKKQFARALGYRDRTICGIQRICYENGYDLLHLPDHLFSPNGFAPIYRSELEINLYKFLKLSVPSPDLSKFPLLYKKRKNYNHG